MKVISNSAIDKVGKIIRQKEKGYNAAIVKLNEWRENHGAVMDWYFDACVNLVKKQGPKDAIVAQRLKRLPTIIDKLNRFPEMRLSKMQDIGGVRLIVANMKQLKLIEAKIKQFDGLVRCSDYIASPKSDGYRGKHFIFEKEGMFVELQLRTYAQHIWATSVETVDIFRGSKMKEGKKAEKHWRDFFCQMSAVFAIIEEEKPHIDYSDFELIKIVRQMNALVRKYDIDRFLKAVRAAGKMIENVKKDDYYFVLRLSTGEKGAYCDASGFDESKYEEAVKMYQELEMESSNNQSVVLVALNDIKEIEKAYPNYFLNLGKMSDLLEYLLATLEKIDKKR